MRKFTYLKLSVLSIAFFATLLSKAQEVQIATWSFPDATVPTSKIIPADGGLISSSASLILDGTYGSSIWPSLITNTGSTTNYPTGVSAATYGIVLTSVANVTATPQVGTNIIFKMPTTGYTGLKFSFVIRNFGTAPNVGYNTINWSYSTDGGSTFSSSVATTTFTTAFNIVYNVDLSGVVDLNEKSEVLLRGVFSGSTGTGGAARLDNVIFKATPAGCSVSGLSFASSSLAKAMGDSKFTVTPTSLNQTTPFSYISSNISVAQVDPNTGEVTLIAPGTTNITANQAQGTHSGTTYCANSTLYTLYVGNTPRTYTLITNATQMVPNEEYLIVAKTNASPAVYYAMGNQDAGNKRPGRLVTDLSGSITTSSSGASTDLLHPFAFKMEQNGASWNMKDIVNAQYLIPNGASTGLKQQVSATSANWNMIFNSNGSDSLSCETAGTYPFNILKFNSGASTLAFNCYDYVGSQGKVSTYLYKYARPTLISVVESSVPVMDATVGNSDSKTLTISGSDLLGDISLAISGPNADQFSISTPTLVQSAGVVSSTSISITYTPTFVAAHSALLTISTPGGTSKEYPLFNSLTVGLNKMNSDERIVVSGRNLIVSGVNGYSIYNAQGAKIKEIQTLNPNFTVNLSSGIYIVKTANKVQKIFIK